MARDQTNSVSPCRLNEEASFRDSISTPPNVPFVPNVSFLHGRHASRYSMFISNTSPLTHFDLIFPLTSSPLRPSLSYKISHRLPRPRLCSVDTSHATRLEETTTQPGRTNSSTMCLVRGAQLTSIPQNHPGTPRSLGIGYRASAMRCSFSNLKNSQKPSFRSREVVTKLLPVKVFASKPLRMWMRRS